MLLGNEGFEGEAGFLSPLLGDSPWAVLPLPDAASQLPAPCFFLLPTLNQQTFQHERFCKDIKGIFREEHHHRFPCHHLSNLLLAFLLVSVHIRSYFFISPSNFHIKYFHKIHGSEYPDVIIPLF